MEVLDHRFFGGVPSVDDATRKRYLSGGQRSDEPFVELGLVPVNVIMPKALQDGGKVKTLSPKSKLRGECMKNRVCTKLIVLVFIGSFSLGCVPCLSARGDHAPVCAFHAAANRTGHQFGPVVQGGGEEDEREGENKLLPGLHPDAGSPDV